MTRLFQQKREGPAGPLRRAVAALCLLLVMLVGAARLLHAHPAKGQSEANCSLCVVAHLSASPSPVVAGPVIVAKLRCVVPPEAIAVASATAVHTFYIRPPPARDPHA